MESFLMNTSSRLIHLFLVKEEWVGLVFIHAFIMFFLLQHKNKIVSELEDFSVDIVWFNTFSPYVLSWVFLRYNLCIINCPSLNVQFDDIGNCIQLCNQRHSEVSSITSNVLFCHLCSQLSPSTLGCGQPLICTYHLHVWLLSLSIMLLWFIHVGACICSLFHFMAEYIP